MQSTTSIGPFRGLWSALGGTAPQGFAGAVLNSRVTDGAVRPRYGFRNLAAKPTGLTDVYGFARLHGYADDYTPRLEWVSVEKRSSVVRPYSVDKDTFARTEITDGGTHLALGSGDWLGFSYNGLSYFVNPGGSPSLFRHQIENDGSWTALQNSTYTPVGDSPSVSAEVGQANQRGWLPTTTDAYTYVEVGMGIVNATTFTATATAGGALEVRGTDHNDGNLNLCRITVVFAVATSLDYDYCAMVATAGTSVLASFERGQKVEVRIGGAWSTPEQFETRAGTKVSVVFRMRGVTGAGSVEAIRMTFAGDPFAHTSGLAWTVSPLLLGGTYLASTATGNRPWLDSPYRTRTERYGVRYRNVAASTYTGIRGVTLNAEQFGTQAALPGGPVGDTVLVAADPDLQAPFVDDPAGTSFRMEFVRQDAAGIWRVVGDAPNTVGQSFRDRRELWELPPLPVADPGDYVPPTPPPVFNSDAFVGGVPFKGWVVWFTAGGKANVRHSRVGNAEALASPGDDVDDIGRGADFTLADDFADEPLGGVQAGDALLVPGRQGVYGQAGNSPSTMTPFRKIPGSMGCCGRFAFARYRDEPGNPGVAWLDASGDNVWFAAAGLVYSTDTQARPVEISAPIRGTLRAFLLAEQISALPALSLSQARMDVDEATGSLWVVLGGRAAVLRPPSPIDGRREWELSEFALGAAGTTPTPGATDPYGTTAWSDVARGGSTLAWSNPTFAEPGVDVASCGGFGAGLSSHWLSGTGFVPMALLPAEATITGLSAVVRHRSPGGSVSLSALQSGALSLAPGHVVPPAFTDFAVDLSALLPLTPVAINAGLSLRLAYDGAIDPKSVNPAYWSFNAVSPPTPASVPPTGTGPFGTTLSFTLVATYTGPLPAPSVVYVAVRSVVGAAGPWGVPGTVFLDNGQGTTSSGTIPNPPVTQPPPADSTVKYALAVSGGAASLTLTHMRTNTGTAPGSADFSGGTVAPSVTSPDPSAVEVESVLMIASYSVPVAEGARSIAFLAFGQRSEGLVWLRSSGHLDAAEWCPTCSRYVEGTNRDGGLSMPEGFWESARLEGPLRRLTRVESERSDFQALSLVGFTERLESGEGDTVPLARRWQRFSPRARGRTHRIRIRVPETLGSVESLDMVFDLVSGPSK